MGIVVRICAYYDWDRTFFVQTLDEHEAKQKAWKMAKQYFSCYMYDSLEEAEEDERIYIHVMAAVDQIII